MVLGSPFSDDALTGAGAHSDQKTMGAGARSATGLKCSFAFAHDAVLAEMRLRPAVFRMGYFCENAGSCRSAARKAGRIKRRNVPKELLACQWISLLPAKCLINALAALQSVPYSLAPCWLKARLTFQENSMQKFDIAVIGAGHAGCEAALAAARLGLSTLVCVMKLLPWIYGILVYQGYNSPFCLHSRFPFLRTYIPFHL